MRKDVNEILRTDKRRRYNTKTSILLATDELPEDPAGSPGRSQHLYMTKKGLFFLVVSSAVPGEETKVKPVDQEEASNIYDNLPRKLENLNEVIDMIHGQQFGRPPQYDKTMKQTSIWFPEEMITWLSKQPKNMSQTIRDLVQAAMDRNP